MARLLRSSWEAATRRVLWALVAAALLLSLTIYCACTSRGTVGVTWDATWKDHRPVVYVPTTQPNLVEVQP